MRCVIHAEPRIPWQKKRAQFFSEGLRRAGIPHEITSHRFRRDGFPILLGTSCWRAIEATGDYLLVDRCSFGDTDVFVTLVWNGHGRRGDHRVPYNAPSHRWERIGVELAPWRTGSRVILCGQTETYSPHWRGLEDWYRSVPATHFRPHPAGKNPTGLPEARDWTDAGYAVTLNSSVGVDAVLSGVPTIAMDEGAMCWSVAGHSHGEIVTPDRLPWAHWLAWTQFSDDEIREGTPWVCRL